MRPSTRNQDPRVRAVPQPGEDRGDVHQLMRREASRAAISRRWACGGSGISCTAPVRSVRLHDLRDREQRDIDKPGIRCRRQRLQQCRRERGGEIRAVGLQRVEHGGRDAPRVIGGQAPLVEHAGGQEQGGQHLT